jgi:RND superfamily putative drug exporter
MSTQQMSTEQMQHKPSFVARMIHRLSVPIIIGWVAIAVILSMAVPSLEQVEREHAITLTPDDAPSFKAMQRMGDIFGEADSDGVAMIILEGEQPLGDAAHAFYDDLFVS